MTTASRSAPLPPAGTPWLEHFPAPNGPCQKTPLLNFPFTIGRNDTADLTIPSTRVSREHALILRAANTYRIRDLDSTNGTFLNGERIEEATLSEGDILLIADLEFTFFSGAATAPRNTVTQVISFRDANTAQPKCLDLVRGLRRLQETLLHGGYAPRYRPVLDLRNNRTLGVEATASPSPAGQGLAEADRLVLASQTHLAARLRELFLLTAAEKSLTQPSQKLFVPLESGELDLNCLDTLLNRLAAVLPDFSCVVLEVPDSDVNDVPYFHRWYRRLRECGAGICFRDFAAGRARLAEYARTPPDFIKLSPALVRGAWRDAHREAACQALFQACGELGCQAIADGLERPEQVELFRRLGCALGQGSACQGSASQEQPPAPAASPALSPPELVSFAFMCSAPQG